MSSRKHLEVLIDDQTPPNKWSLSLRENVFHSFVSRGDPTLLKIFTGGSFFSPLLFGKFFDPSDAFPLWEFESDILLSSYHKSGQSTSDWFETESEYGFKAELPPDFKKYGDVKVCIEKGKVLEISGQWKDQGKSSTKDWRSEHWWEFGYVRRIELPENADWSKIEAHIDEDVILEIKLPKNQLNNGAGNGLA